MLEKAKNYIGYIVAFILLLFCIDTCVDSAATKLSGEVKVLEKQFEKKVEDADRARVLSMEIIEALHKDNATFKADNARLKQENITLRNKMAKIDKEKDGKIAAAKNYTYKESAKVIGEAHNMPNSVSYNDKGVTMTDKLPNRVVETIIERDACEEKEGLQEQEIANLKQENSNLEQENENKDTEIKTLNDLSKMQDETLDASKELTDTYKKENKKLKTNRTIARILIPAAFVLGVLIAK